MKLPGNVTISRVSFSHGEDYISIKIVDETSKVHFVEAMLSLQDFALAITGRGFMDCELDVRGLDLVGLQREGKKEPVMVPKGSWDTREERAYAAVRALEVDGWKGRLSDVMNHHNRRADRDTEAAECWMVTYERRVPREAGDVPAE